MNLLGFTKPTNNAQLPSPVCNLTFLPPSFRSVTGVCMGSTSDSLMVINWRTKTVTEISYDGHTIGSFTHEDFK